MKFNILNESEDLWDKWSKLNTDGKCVVCERKSKRGKVCPSCCSNLKRHKTKEALVSYKGGACQKCGYSKSLRALTFHHLDPAKKSFSISNMQSMSFPLLIKEVDKCMLLCHNCHAEEHEKIDLEKNELTIKRWNHYQNIKNNKLIKCKKCKECLKEYKPRNRKQQFCSVSCGRCFYGGEKPSKKILQKLVWEMPTTMIAEIYSVSDVAVSKWCKKFNINKPSRGYWAKNSWT